MQTHLKIHERRKSWVLLSFLVFKLQKWVCSLKFNCSGRSNIDEMF